MKVVSLDVHKDASQMVVSDGNGNVLKEMRVPTSRTQLRRAVCAVEGEKHVIFEEGPLSVLVFDALEDVAEKVVSSDPAYNALIARDEDSDDERDARNLAKLYEIQAVREVYVPREPYVSLRSVLSHRRTVRQMATATKNRIKALARRNGLGTEGKRLYESGQRESFLTQIPTGAMRWQMQSLWRMLDGLEVELTKSKRQLAKITKRLPVVERLQSIPGVGPITSATIVARVVNPGRFKSRKALSAYAGLGLGQGVTNWQPLGPARASRRGNRELKRVLFLAAGAAARTRTALGERYRVRQRQGWSEPRAKRDLARKILYISSALWKKGTEYQDRLVNGPQIRC